MDCAVAKGAGGAHLHPVVALVLRGIPLEPLQQLIVLLALCKDRQGCVWSVCTLGSTGDA